MDVLNFFGSAANLLLSLVILVVLAIVGFHVAWYLIKTAVLLAPLGIAIAGGLKILAAGHDNVAVLFFIGGVVVECVWWHSLGKHLFKPTPAASSSDYDWKDRLIKTYDAEGRHTGYKDRE